MLISGMLVSGMQCTVVFPLWGRPPGFKETMRGFADLFFYNGCSGSGVTNADLTLSHTML